MTYLIANLSTGKGTWAHLYKVIESGNFEKVLLLTNEFGKEKFNADDKTELIVKDTRKDAAGLSKDFYEALKGKIDDTEVAVNLVSGSGNEHMALISALLKLGIGIRLVDVDEDGKIEEL